MNYETLSRKATTLTNHADRAEMKAHNNGTRDLPEVSMRLSMWRRAAHRAQTQARALRRAA